MNKSREKVELHPAFFWICPECGIDNYERSMNIEGQEIPGRIEEEIRNEMGLEDWEEVPDDIMKSINVFMAPVDVKCKTCNYETTTISPNG